MLLPRIAAVQALVNKLAPQVLYHLATSCRATCDEISNQTTAISAGAQTDVQAAELMPHVGSIANHLNLNPSELSEALKSEIFKKRSADRSYDLRYGTKTRCDTGYWMFKKVFSPLLKQANGTNELKLNGG